MNFKQFLKEFKQNLVHMLQSKDGSKLYIYEISDNKYYVEYPDGKHDYFNGKTLDEVISKLIQGGYEERHK